MARLDRRVFVSEEKAKRCFGSESVHLDSIDRPAKAIFEKNAQRMGVRRVRQSAQDELNSRDHVAFAVGRLFGTDALRESP